MKDLSKERLVHNLPAALIVSNNATRRMARSAQPDAPVVPDRPRRPAPAARPRAALARGLERLAGAISPAPACCTPTACTPAS